MKLSLNRESLLKLLFFSSGFSCLTLQIAWQRILGQVVGIDYFSTVIIVSIFMLGLGLGGILGSQISHRMRRPLAFFIYAEMAIACFAVFSDSLLRQAAIFSAQLGSVNLSTTSLTIDFGVYLALLIVPITLMGTSLPIVVQSAKPSVSAGVSVGRLYAINIAGACVGTFISGFFLIGYFGLKKTMIFAAGVNLIIALLTLLSMRATPEVVQENQQTSSPSVAPFWNLKVAKYFLLSLIVGFLAIGYQILYFRIYVYYFGSTSYVFPMVLMIYLYFLWQGTSLSARKLATEAPLQILRESFSKILLSTSVLFVLPYVLKLAGYAAPDSTNISPTRPIESLLVGAVVTLSTLLPVRYLSLIFPVLVQSLTDDQKTLGKRTGEVYVVQTFGNTLGAFLTGALLIPYFGTTVTAQIFLLAIFVLFLIFLAATSSVSLFKSQSAYAHLLATIVILMFMSPKFFQQFVHMMPPHELAEPTRVFEEHVATTFTYENREKTSAQIIAGEGATSFSYLNVPIKLWPMDVAMTALARPPKSILIIGLGTGVQALAVHMLYPQAKVVVVELLHTVIDEVEKYGSPDLKELLQKSEILVTDGTRFVNKRSGESETFDLIQIGIFRITASASGNLFTTEFFTKLKGVLAPDGVLTGNANVNSVKSAMHAYKNVIVAARSEGEISDFIATDNAPTSVGQFGEAYTQELKDLRKLVRPGSSSTRLDFVPPEKAFFVLNPETLKRALVGFPEQTNDLIASENFLMNKTYFYKFKDTRRWPKEFADLTLVSALPQVFQ